MSPSGFQLAVACDAWQQMLRELLRDPDKVAVGTCRRNTWPGHVEFLVDDLHSCQRPPRGEDFPPLADWCVLALPTNSLADDPASWLHHLQPRDDQSLTLLLVGMGADRRGWDGVVCERKSITPLSVFRVPGPGMLFTHRDDHSDEGMIPFDSTSRDSRTKGALGDDVYRRLARLRALILGTGRTGSAAAHLLAALGIESATLVDPDLVGVENLDMYGVTPADIGRPKVLAVQQHLVALRPECTVAAIQGPAACEAAIERARTADVIISCGDRPSCAYAGALLANRFLKVHLDIGTGVERRTDGSRQLAADIRLLLARQACARCVAGEADEAAARQELVTGRPPHPVAWHEERAGTIITLNTLTVAYGVQLLLDLIAGRVTRSIWHRLLWRGSAGLQVDAADVAGDPGCPICQWASPGKAA